MILNYDDQEETIEVEETEEETVEEEAETETEEETVDWEARAKKAEAAIIKAKQKKDVVKPASSNGIALSDQIAILNAKVHEDDIERVERYAKAEGMSLRDALKDPELKAILSLREEQRNTAVATNTGNARRGSTKISEDALIANANSGKLPESDEEIERLVAAKLKRK